MPQWVVDKLNEKAAAGKKKVPDDPVFTCGNAKIESGEQETVPPEVGVFKQVSPRGDAADYEPLGVILDDTTHDGNRDVSQLNVNQEPVERVMNNEGVAFADNSGDGELVEEISSEGVMSANNTGDDEPVAGRFLTSSHEPIEGVASANDVGGGEPVVAEPEPAEVEQRAGRGGRAVRRDYRRDATLLEKGSRKWAWQLTVNKALDKFGAAAVKSLCSELLQMHNKGVWRPVSVQGLSMQQRKKIIRSSMFLKEKFLSTGEFQKLKARLVAGGHMQDRSVYTETDTEAPTASLQSVYMIASIAAHEGRAVVTADITGAYLNADMKKVVHMRLEPKLAEVLAALEPSYQEYVNSDGTLVVTLQKALYGCVESARLWYDNISGLLKSDGFEQNTHERCVFNKVIDGEQLTICIYVDDLLVTCKNIDLINQVMLRLTETYNDITVHEGMVHSYLGQTFDFSLPKRVSITMTGYVDEMLEEYEIEGCAATPATEKLFNIDEDSATLTAGLAEDFHSRVAKLLYLAKRVRPDILTAVAFLSTRVQQPTEEDWQKLERLLKYINCTRDMGICLETGTNICIFAYVDASFAVHGDMKSHTGGVISLGKGPIYVKSSKQKLMSKSSTEAELIGVSDMLPQVIWTRAFLAQQGYSCGPATVFQDNQSTIVLANKGFSTSEKTRHIAIRYFFVKDRIDAGEVSVQYLCTEDMLADVMTKPLQGSLFRKLRSLLMNYK